MDLIEQFHEIKYSEILLIILIKEKKNSIIII